MPVKKKTTLKQKQRQSQKVVVNIDNSNRAPRRRRRKPTQKQSNQQQVQQQAFQMRAQPIIINNTLPQQPQQPFIQQPQFNNSGFQDINERLNDMSRNFSTHAQNISEQLNNINRRQHNMPNVNAEPLYADVEPIYVDEPPNYKLGATSNPKGFDEPFKAMPTYATPPPNKKPPSYFNNEVPFTPPIFNQPKMEKEKPNDTFKDLSSVKQILFKTPILTPQENALVPYTGNNNTNIEDLEEEKKQLKYLIKETSTPIYRDYNLIKELDRVSKQIKELKSQEEEMALVPYKKPPNKNTLLKEKAYELEDKAKQLIKESETKPGKTKQALDATVEYALAVEKKRNTSISTKQYEDFIDMLENIVKDNPKEKGVDEIKNRANDFIQSTIPGGSYNGSKPLTVLNHLKKFDKQIKEVLRKVDATRNNNKTESKSSPSSEPLQFGMKLRQITNTNNDTSNTSKNIIV